MRLQHVSICIDEDGAEAARDFYGTLLGLEERDVPPKLDPAQLLWFRAGGDLEVHLIRNGDAPPPRAHFCLALESGLDDVRRGLRDADVDTWTPTEIVGRPRFMCRDPFGNVIELTQLPARGADA